MPKFKKYLAIGGFVAASWVFGSDAAVLAQRAGTGAGGAGGAGEAASAGGMTTPGGIGSLDVDTAFTAIERGDTVGSTGNTGAGFSSLSVAQPGGAGGLGGGLGGRGFGGGGFGGLGGLGGLFGNAGGTTQNVKPTIRTRLRSAVNAPAIPNVVVQQNANDHLRLLPSTAGVNGISVSVEAGTAVVTGIVQNEHDRRMSELLMRLEPGVRRVENRVIIAP